VNNEAKSNIPFYLQWPVILIGFYVLISILSIGQTILLPLIYASILAILISPVVNYLERRKINRGLAIGFVLAISLICIGGVLFLIVSQSNLLIEAMPELSDKLKVVLHQFAEWASGYFNVSVKDIESWFETEKVKFLKNSNLEIGTTLTTAGSVLATLFLTPVYIFMILFYQPHIIVFFYKLFGAGNKGQVSEILGETRTVIRGYLVGLFLEFVIIAVLNSLGLLLLGIEYAIILGIAGALLNVIPYVGGLVAVGVFATIALLTKTPIYVAYVMILYMVIQFVDNNYIVPKIVGSKVKLNALFSILAVVSGGALWGVPGMFLSIPLMAIIKLIADRIDPLQPWGFLLGDTMPPLIDIKVKRFRAKSSE
jgi:predicted PurR-regulated permease PerM